RSPDSHGPARHSPGAGTGENRGPKTSTVRPSRRDWQVGDVVAARDVASALGGLAALRGPGAQADVCLPAGPGQGPSPQPPFCGYRKAVATGQSLRLRV